jgi:hypothetical protein
MVLWLSLEVADMTEKAESFINLRVPAEFLTKIDEAVQMRPLRMSRHAWIMEAVYQQLQRETTEGTLDIFWENNEDRTASPTYRLVFCRYVRFQGGAIRPNRIVGDESLRSHLISLNFTKEQAKRMIEKVKAEKSVPIPNVTMPMEQLFQYGYGTSGGGTRER